MWNGPGNQEEYFKPYAQLVRGSGFRINYGVTKEILFQQDPQYFDFGTPLGKDLYGIRPDLIKIAKGLASSYLQLFRVIMGERVWKVI